jgi:hypothetical protein
VTPPTAYRGRRCGCASWGSGHLECLAVLTREAGNHPEGARLIGAAEAYVDEQAKCAFRSIEPRTR